ncbi:trypsin-like serine peptidase [Catenuloplanes indicus]|uniref:Serine protease n=1 Tax=Catenuloplanes indicus TaxID=137267 RepID=A0AAE3W8A4_9ACTN|nr:trypsin-like serine protease [Catenuloplanes indicus]MDQ0370342.1 glutamyl endopeptidase [Catenuloplanes indicus]
MRLTTPGGRLRSALIGGAALSLALAGLGAPAAAVPADSAAAPVAPHTTVADDNAPPRAVVPARAAAAGGAGISGTTGSGVLTPTTSPAVTGARAPGAGLSGGFGTDTVIGTDNRTRVNPTTPFPTSAIVQIIRVDGSTTWGCTGWVYGANIIATAGHCVHPGGGANGGGGNGFYPRANYTIIPARNGTTNPFGTCTATQLMSVNGWMADGSADYDYGAIRLSCNAGASTGTFGFWWQSASLTGTATTVSGYPCDKTFGEQWRHAGMTVTSTAARRVYYQNDTAGCQSGSPVYQTRAAGSSFCVGQCTMAIHAYGGSSNSGTRITEPVYNNLISWRG